MKIISVIIPLYNSALYIGAAVESALAQKLPKGDSLEVIVVDDGSTDNPRHALKPYLDKITFKEMVHCGNPAVVRNTAIALSKGEYVAFLDADDMWSPNKLVSQLPAFDDPEVVLAYSNAEIMTADGKPTRKPVVEPGELADGERFSSLLQHNVISTLTTIVRRSALDEVGLFGESDLLHGIEDYHLWLRIAARYPKGLRANAKQLAYYRKHDHNISTADSITAIERIVDAFVLLWHQARLTGQQRADLEAATTVMQENWSREQVLTHPTDQPLISVVMGVYNGGACLPTAIASILSQTYTNFEFIIIDDGSTDGSAEVIANLNDSRIRLIQQQNHGLVYSLNKGIRLARGRYIARQDADDISLPSRFEKELQLLTSDVKLGIVGSYFTYVHETTLEPTITIAGPTLDIDIKRAMYFHNPLGHGTVMMRKAIFSNTGPYTDAYGPVEDFELWHRVADNWRFGIVPESLYLYRLSSGGISHTKSDLQHNATARIINEQWQKPPFTKSASDIVRDGRYYRSLPSPQAYDAYKQYVSQQIDLAKDMLGHGRFRAGALAAYGAWRLEHVGFGKYIRPALRGTIHQARKARRLL